MDNNKSSLPSKTPSNAGSVGKICTRLETLKGKLARTLVSIFVTSPYEACSESFGVNRGKKILDYGLHTGGGNCGYNSTPIDPLYLKDVRFEDKRVVDCDLLHFRNLDTHTHTHKYINTYNRQSSVNKKSHSADNGIHKRRRKKIGYLQKIINRSSKIKLRHDTR